MTLWTRSYSPSRDASSSRAKGLNWTRVLRSGGLEPGLLRMDFLP